jgi:hypothetical protein
MFLSLFYIFILLGYKLSVAILVQKMAQRLVLVNVAVNLRVNRISGYLD